MLSIHPHSDEVLHVYPEEPFDHELDEHGTCACGPRVEWSEQDGSPFWYYRHFSLFSAENPPVDFTTVSR